MLWTVQNGDILQTEQWQSEHRLNTIYEGRGCIFFDNEPNDGQIIRDLNRWNICSEDCHETLITYLVLMVLKSMASGTNRLTPNFQQQQISSK